MIFDLQKRSTFLGGRAPLGWSTFDQFTATHQNTISAVFFFFKRHFEWFNNLLIADVDLPSPFIFSLHEEVFGCREAGGEERESEEEVEDCLGVHGCCCRLGCRCQSALYIIIRAVYLREGSKKPFLK